MSRFLHPFSAMCGQFSMMLFCIIAGLVMAIPFTFTAFFSCIFSGVAMGILFEIIVIRNLAQKHFPKILDL